MLREYKFIVKIREEGKLLNWLHEVIYLVRVIEIGNYDFIEGRVWIDLKTYNSAIANGIDLCEVRF